MLGTIIWIVVCIATGTICYLAGKNRNKDNEYLRGRGAGWKACEDMVWKRIQESPEYDNDMWVDLMQ